MSKITAIVITPEGEMNEIEIEQGCEPLQELVGGYIETTYSEDGAVTFWINEEGKILGLPVNMPATLLWWEMNQAFVNADVLCGTVVLTGGADAKGDTLSVPAALIEVTK